jgi:hypothetical protein
MKKPIAELLADDVKRLGEKHPIVTGLNVESTKMRGTSTSVRPL